MTSIYVINPNTTVSMTAKIGAAARAVATAESEIHAVNPADGPVSIEGHYDEAYCIPGLLEEIRKAERERDRSCGQGYVIACFDDTGLGAARELARGPVVGIGEAAMHVAALLGNRFSIVTTLARSVPILEHNAERYGFGRICRRVRAASVPVLALEEPGSDARERLKTEAERALAEDGAEVIVLGCAGMADLTAWLADRLGVPVIDGVAAAVKLVEGLLALGLNTSKIGGYAYPRVKPYGGAFADRAPGG